jgi:hypothetical protein
MDHAAILDFPGRRASGGGSPPPAGKVTIGRSLLPDDPASERIRDVLAERPARA